MSALEKPQIHVKVLHILNIPDLMLFCCLPSLLEALGQYMGTRQVLL